MGGTKGLNQLPSSESYFLFLHGAGAQIGRECLVNFLWLNYKLYFNNIVSSKVYINKGLTVSTCIRLFGNRPTSSSGPWAVGFKQETWATGGAIFDLWPLPWISEF